MSDDNEPLVTITGPALAMLLYENNKISDQHGFLLGDVQVFVSTKVTDSDRDVEHRKLQINIKSIVAYPISAPFYNGAGQVDQDMVKKFLGRNVNKVVGWYHHRDYFPTHRRSMRDTIMHSHLSRLFSNELLSKDNFLFFCLGCDKSDSHGTLKWKQLLYRVDGIVYKTLSFKIINLGADATRPDGTDYKPIPQSSYGVKDAFEKIYKEIRNDIQSVQPGINAVNMVQNAAETYLLQKIIPALYESDNKLSALEEKVFELRNKKFEKKFMDSPLGLQYKMQKMEMESKQNSKPQNPDSDEDMFDLPEAKSFDANSTSRLGMNGADEKRSYRSDPPPTAREVVMNHYKDIFDFLRDNDFQSKTRKREQGSGESINHIQNTESKTDHQTPPRGPVVDEDGFVTIRRPGPKSSKMDRNDKQNRSMKDAGDS